MGKGRRQRNRDHSGRKFPWASTADGEEQDAPANGSGRRNSPRLGPYSVIDCPPASRDQGFHQSQFPPSHNRSKPLPVSHDFRYQKLLRQSTQLKEYLTSSLQQTLARIQQWYPEALDIESEWEQNYDEMDWQREKEVCIPIPEEGQYYTWGHRRLSAAASLSSAMLTTKMPQNWRDWKRKASIDDPMAINEFLQRDGLGREAKHSAICVEPRTRIWREGNRAAAEID
ncbi:hypothetical protein B0J14DRAFT_658680 [Halenospora varia]|nr:hypothetical protein B0J14DRAFT_658680 [Halenospora varia]